MKPQALPLLFAPITLGLEFEALTFSFAVPDRVAPELSGRGEGPTQERAGRLDQVVSRSEIWRSLSVGRAAPEPGVVAAKPAGR